jgi:hypothetical protein
MPSVHNSFSFRVLKENRRVVKSDADSGSDRTAEIDNFHGSALRRARRMFPARVLLTAFRPLDISSSMRGVLMDISLGIASERCRKFICDAYVRGASCPTAASAELEGSTSVFTKRRRVLSFCVSIPP